MEYYKETPAVVARATTYDATVSSSTEITFNTSSKMIEVCAVSKPIVLKWGTSDASAASSGFDEVIPADTVRQFVIPVDASTGATYTAANFIEQAASAVLIVIEK